LPNGIVVYFDSVGGQMLDSVLSHANDFARRIVACGIISQYNLEQFEPLYNSLLIVVKRIKIEGFVILDQLELEQEFLDKVTPMLLTGEIKYIYDVALGIEKTPHALVNVLAVNFLEGKLFT
jgi:NADPH-dependent curcumin reductase CurA